MTCGWARRSFNTTKTTAKAYVGNGLACASCHLEGGTVAYAAPLVGLWGVFPEFVARSDRVETLEDRINDCFRRSMNGRPLPVDGAEMRALLAYTAWLSTGVPTGSSVVGRGFADLGVPPAAPDAGRGERVYAQQCAACHGADGAGLRAGDTYAVPPLWGPQSFNDRAGMARVSIAAAFVHAKMPLGRGGALTPQQAFDVAAFFTCEAPAGVRGEEQRLAPGCEARGCAQLMRIAGVAAARHPAASGGPNGRSRCRFRRRGVKCAPEQDTSVPRRNP